MRIHGLNMRIQRIQEYTWVNMRIQGCTEVYMGEHENTWGVQEYTWVNMRIQGLTGVYMGEHENTGVSIHG